MPVTSKISLDNLPCQGKLRLDAFISSSLDHVSMSRAKAQVGVIFFFMALRVMMMSRSSSFRQQSRPGW
jgi:hypothetical protein